MPPLVNRLRKHRHLIFCLLIITVLIGLAGCNLPGREAAETQEPEPLLATEEVETPPPPAEAEDTSILSTSTGAELDVSIVVTDEDTQGRIMRVIVRNDAVSETFLYWTDPGADKIQRAQVDEGGIQDLVDEGLDEPRGIALDIRRNKMLWTDPGNDRIQRADLDGGDVEDIVVDGLWTPFGLTLGNEMDTIFWSDPEALTLTRANIDGSDPTPAIGVFTPATFGTTVDDVHGKLYWIEEGQIRSANLDGSNVQPVISNEEPAQAIAVDPKGRKVYWTEEGRIQRASLDGSGVELLVDDFNGPSYGIALDVSEGLMYWTEFDNSRIRRASFDGSQVEDVILGLETPSGLALLKSGDAYVQLPCGLILEPGEGSTDFQRMMVIQRDGGTVPAGESAEFLPYVICVDAGLDLPETQLQYRLGTMAEGELLKLAECICDRKLVSEEEDPIAYIGEQFGLQFSVWQVSGSLTSDELREQLGEGGGAMDEFGELLSMFDSIGEMLPDYVDWIEECGVEISP
jgi:hypothetical protein